MALPLDVYIDLQSESTTRSACFGTVNSQDLLFYVTTGGDLRVKSTANLNPKVLDINVVSVDGVFNGAYADIYYVRSDSSVWHMEFRDFDSNTFFKETLTAVSEQARHISTAKINNRFLVMIDDGTSHTLYVAQDYRLLADQFRIVCYNNALNQERYVTNPRIDVHEENTTMPWILTIAVDVLNISTGDKQIGTYAVPLPVIV